MAASVSSELARKLEQINVPVSHDPCRSCADPCDDVHGDWPPRFEVDMDSTLLGSTNPLHRQVVISTGQSDWAREVTEAPGTIAAILLNTREVLGPASLPAPVPKGVPAPLPESSKMHGVFSPSDSNKLSILNGSHVTVADKRGDETVLLFPDYSMIVGVRATEDSVDAFYKTVLDPALAADVPLTIPHPLADAGLHAQVLPYACVIMLCSHKRRDNRCHIAAPKLEERFCSELEHAGWDVHTRLHDPDHDHGFDANTSRDDRLRAAASSHSALIVKTSHIGGHRYAGNVQIMFPQGSCIWYARVSPHEVHAVVQHTILGGKILPDLLRAGMNIVRAENKTLLDW